MSGSRSFAAGATPAAVAAKADKYATQSKTASFTAAAGVVYLIDSTSGAVTVTLPAANSAGQTLAVKWVGGSNTVTVQRAGSDTIGAATTSAAMGLLNEVWEFVSSGSGQWNLVGGNKTLASLDGRYPLLYDWTPPDHNLKAWTYDPILAPGGNVGGTAGTLNGGKLRLTTTQTITNIVMHVATAGSALTTGQCFAALYTGAGVLLDKTADQAAAWASTGLKTMALAGGAVSRAAGDYIVVWWANGTTPPAMARVPALASALANAGLTTPNLRNFIADTGITTTPPSSLGTQSVNGNCWWIGLS